MSPSSNPDYYSVLDVSPTATPQQIRDAYKRAALKTHPDRVPSDSPDRASRTRKFQLINDAYYTLSDATRRREYDLARPHPAPGGFTSGPSAASDEDAWDIPRPSDGAGTGGNWWENFGFNTHPNREEAESAQFGDVFEEMLREEGMANEAGHGTGRFWSVVGGLSGAAMGFIVANFPGMVAGAVAGNRLGAVRDARGMSVYSVFQELPQGDKARLLSQLAAKVFAHAVGVGE
ncbi:hypothetical protein GMDG_06463 [Pseudogymnoascus destructans 20631-21]|uniref:J domain-containing protein n=1 Tax=Pseudogymnoascus destructans (strain ATCC MYA-4855 / 20631-21) TaxID=658429 RepID=L8FSI5_PSED2|nr:hypothetical protein GMDG_06463 [Pseudogymnoascus destructans 20631-21]